MQVNANTLSEFSKFANYIWSGPLEIILSLIILYMYIGNTVFAGIAVMIVVTPINSYIAHRFSLDQENKLVVSDSRIKVINEVLNGIKVS